MNIEKQIEFDKVRALWSSFAITDGAKEEIQKAWELPSLYWSSCAKAERHSW